MAAAILIAGILVPAGSASAATPTVERWSGSDRYSTSAEISARTFAPGVPAVFIASGTNFPDALSGAAAAGAMSSPLLLTYPDSLSPQIVEELRRLRPGTIHVLGGDQVVTGDVFTSLEEFAPVRRLAGDDRYATSVEISKAIFPAGATTVHIASGAMFPDALSAAPAAGGGRGPLLLTDPWSLPPVVEEELGRLVALGLTSIVVAGGPAAVSDDVVNRIQAVTGVAVRRVADVDRYATSAAFTRSFAPGVGTVYLASGTTFPDALAGAAAARGAPLLLTAGDTLPLATARELKRLRPSRIVVLGGTSAVSAIVGDRSAIVAADIAPASGGSLSRDTEVRAGSCMSSPDSSHQLCVRGDIGFGVFRGQSALWTSGTPDPAVLALRIRSDGLAVLYAEDGRILWNSSTSGTSATALAMQNDGDTMLRTATGAIVWSTMTSASAPRWRLPFATGASWSAGAPHANSGGTPGARAALDFGPRAGGDRRVLAVAAGTVYRIQCAGGSYLGVDHGNGWQSTYYHLVDYQQQLVGQVVPAGTYLGEVGRTVPCGGGATFDHVHLVIRNSGTPVSVEGMTFGGYRVHSGGTDYHGWWTDASGRRVLTASGGAACCLTAG